MENEVSRTCVECQGQMSAIIIMDKYRHGLTKHRDTMPLEYRLPDDHLSFWTGRYPSAGEVKAFMCANCGRIALYGGKPESAADDGPVGGGHGAE